MAKKLNKSSLLWFIRSRPYTTVAEIRRRFSLDPEEVHAIRSARGTLYVGLPERPAQLLGQLLQEGRVGIELSPEVHAPVVDGVFPMDLREYRERLAQHSGTGNAVPGPPAEQETDDEADGSDDDE